MAKPADVRVNGHQSENSVNEIYQSDGSPVMIAITKRLRNARKRLRGIDEIQAKKDAGKELNADQVGLSGGASGDESL